MRFYLYTESMRTGKCSATLNSRWKVFSIFCQSCRSRWVCTWSGRACNGWGTRGGGRPPIRAFTRRGRRCCCSCKGLEPGLERNLTTLTEFDHQNYETFFVLASESDPAYAIVKRVAASARTKAHVVIVADKPEGCGEKVNNLRFAIEGLPPDFEFLAFADSDGRPGKSWLKKLVAPLADARVGATTTMRWLIPNRSNLATVLLAAWNAPIVTMLSEKGKNFCWGGGMAIRRDVFDKIGVAEDWKNSISDDYSMTRALQRANRPIMFLPECLTLSYVETDFPGLLEFTNRQILITRVYAQEMWAFGLATHLLYCLTLLLGVFLTLGDVMATLPAFHQRSYVSSGFAGGDSQQLTRCRSNGSAAGSARADHGPSLDLHSFDDLRSLPVSREFRDFTDDA